MIYISSSSTKHVNDFYLKILSVHFIMNFSMSEEWFCVRETILFNKFDVKRMIKCNYWISVIVSKFLFICGHAITSIRGFADK